jgi:outer membrane lipoprotein-sorting protein
MIAGRLATLVLLGVVLSSVACGTRAPSSPSAWLERCFEQLESKDVQARFRMWLDFQSQADTEPTIDISLERRGSIQYRNDGYFRMEADTSFIDRAQGEAVPTQIVRDLQVGDGENRWVRTSFPDGSQPIILKLPLDGARTSGESGRSVGAAPCDLDPIALLRLCSDHAEYQEVLASEKRYVVLVGTALPSMQKEARRLGSGFLPKEIRITLDRDTALPIELEILREAESPDARRPLGSLTIRYLAWTVAPIADDFFTFTPPPSSEDG